MPPSRSRPRRARPRRSRSMRRSHSPIRRITASKLLARPDAGSAIAEISRGSLEHCHLPAASTAADGPRTTCPPSRRSSMRVVEASDPLRRSSDDDDDGPVKRRQAGQRVCRVVICNRVGRDFVRLPSPDGGWFLRRFRIAAAGFGVAPSALRECRCHLHLIHIIVCCLQSFPAFSKNELLRLQGFRPTSALITAN